MNVAEKHRSLGHLNPGDVSLYGTLGKAIRLVTANRLSRVDYHLLVSPFRDHSDGRPGANWRGEFWGKTIRSAIRAWEADPSDDKLKGLIRSSIAELLATQEENGCISTYPPGRQATGWDIWGRKYVLLALARYCESVKPEPVILDAMERALDHVISLVGPGGRPFREAGAHEGMAPASILGAVLKVYRATGKERFLDFARFIVEEGAASVFRAIASGKPPRGILTGKAYEMTSCAEGLVELSRDTGEGRYLETALRYYHAVRDHEIFVTGGGGLKDDSGELWDEGRLKQTRTEGVGYLGETCVTVTWIRFALQILRETRDVSVADEIERSLYNSLLGAMTPDGVSFSHRGPTPLAGGASRTRAGFQIRGFGDFDCCLAQGPEGIATAARFAALADGGGLYVNLYEPSAIRLPGGGSLHVVGGYPYGAHVVAEVRLPAPRKFAIRFRIPGWSARTRCLLNGQVVEVRPGSYAPFDRDWRSGDCIEFYFDDTLRVVPAPDGSPLVACFAGPILYARDSDLGYLDAPVALGESASPYGTYPAPLFRRLLQLSGDGSLLADYASCGNRFDCGNLLRVWLPRKG